MKWFITLLLILCMSSSVLALDTCKEHTNVDEACTLITPSLTCSIYYYDIFNSSGDLVKSGYLTNYSGQTLYSTTFQQNISDTYTIQVCDGSTIQISVGGADMMFLIVIVLLPLIAGFGFLYWSSQVSEEHQILKLLFQLFFIPLLFLSINFGVVGVSLISNNAELITLLADLTYYLGWVLFIVGAYLCFNLLMRVKDLVLQKKADKEREQYD